MTLPAPTPTRPDARPTTDPLTAYVARIAPRPLPLTATTYAIDLKGAFAAVTATRTFRNAETGPIEATLTFPVPVGAVVHHLEARTAGRTLIAKAQLRKAARETYEDALDRGKTAVLHEELLRGIHMLSVGAVAPGAEVEVTMRWSMLATCQQGRTMLRIPTTVGDVYGHSRLPDSDDLAHAPRKEQGTIRVRSDARRLMVNGAVTDGPEATLTVGLDAPIDIEAGETLIDTVTGRMADGRTVALRIAPATAFDTPVLAAILIDRSGSMNEAVSGEDGAKISKHGAVLLALSEAAHHMRDGDSLALYEFDDACRLVGHAASPDALRGLLRQASPVGGGTEIGGAIAQAIAEGARDILLITDGKSFALDVQALAKPGARITVVLAGEDSLEANVGHLAALTGGSIFPALGADLGSAIGAAAFALRQPHSVEAAGTELAVTRSGLTLGAVWSKGEVAERTVSEQAVAALAASLLLPGLDEEAASELSLGENLVGHLTSLVLVDETSPSVSGLSGQRKIPLPSPRTRQAAAGLDGTVMYALSGISAAIAGPYVPRAQAKAAHAAATSVAVGVAKTAAPPATSAPTPPKQAPSLAAIALTIDWQSRPQRLIAGDLAVLPTEAGKVIADAAKTTAVETAARRLGLAPIALVIGLMARSRGDDDRMAARVARAILKSADAKLLDDLARQLRLPVPQPARQPRT